MKTNQLEIFDTALQYINKGFSVLPVGEDKKPLLAWKKYQTERADETTLTQWVKQFPNMNIGICTGEISGITVIDIDVKSGQADVILQTFPKTYMVKTPSGGYHLYYKYQPGFTVSANAYKDLPYVDIRGATGFVVAPPSETPKGKYEIINDMEIQPFPVHLFPKTKVKKTLTEMTTASKGQRNDTLASFAGKLLQSSTEEEWEIEVFPAVQRANKTYTPVLSDHEVRQVFESIVKKEKERRADLIISPIQLPDGQEVPAIAIKLRRNGANVPYKDMANCMIVLSTHPFYKNTIKYNTFKQEIEYSGVALEDSDINKIQYFMQAKAGLPSIGKEAVFSAILHYAYQNVYDEAQDWLKSLVWDGTPRLREWLPVATGVPNDTYHQGIGSQWFMGIIKRIMMPGCIWDYILVTTGAQGIGKTSMFRIIGGPWYKSFTGSVENKDFYLALRGAIIVDLDEGATLYKAEAIKIKSIITQTHDEFRAPYDRVMKKYPRRFVFSMSTNDSEPFRDVTGNRRYWALDLPNQMINFKWLEDNRDQIFAETYHYFKNKNEIPEVPEEEAREIQEAHLPDDSWTELVVAEIRTSDDYCKGDPNYSTTILEVFSKIFPNESIVRLDRRHEMRMGNIFKKKLGLEKRREMIEGERKTRWYIMPQMLKILQENNAPKTIEELDEF